MSVRGIIDCSWLLVVCTISPEGKRHMHMNQEGLLSMTLVFLSLSESLTATLQRRSLSCLSSTKRVSRSDIAYTLHHPWPHVSLSLPQHIQQHSTIPTLPRKREKIRSHARNLAKKYKVYGVGLFDFDWFRIALHCIIWHGIMFAVSFTSFA